MNELGTNLLCMLTFQEAALAKDAKNELEATLNLLSGKGKGSKGKAPRGPERKKLWEEVKALRREYVLLHLSARSADAQQNRYRQRESSVVKSVLSEVQVRELAAPWKRRGTNSMLGCTCNVPYVWRSAAAKS